MLATVRETGSGLGYGGMKSIDMTSQTSKAIFWRKAQKRYEATDVLNSIKNSSNENSGKRKNKHVRCKCIAQFFSCTLLSNIS